MNIETERDLARALAHPTTFRDLSDLTRDNKLLSRLRHKRPNTFKVLNISSTWYKSGWFKTLDKPTPEDYIWNIIIMVNAVRESLPTIDSEDQATAVARALRNLAGVVTKYAEQLNPQFDEDE